MMEGTQGGYTQNWEQPIPGLHSPCADEGSSTGQDVDFSLSPILAMGTRSTVVSLLILLAGACNHSLSAVQGWEESLGALNPTAESQLFTIPVLGQCCSAQGSLSSASPPLPSFQ